VPALAWLQVPQKMGHVCWLGYQGVEIFAGYDMVDG